MRNRIFVRPLQAKDADKILTWLKDTPQNLWDPAVMNYPTTFTPCAYDTSGPIAFQPVQKPFMLESLAINPDADNIKVASALKELTHAAVTQAHIEGAGEIYFMCKEESTCEFAKRQLFEELPYRLFRIKLKDTECTQSGQASS